MDSITLTLLGMMTHPIIKRNYLCRVCGTLRRAPADYIPDAPPAPECCGRPMTMLSYEQTVAATQLSPTERTDWLAAGSEIIERGGKHRWKAVWPKGT